MNECDYCKERESRVEKYEEEIEKQVALECLKALEREKIANGMQSTKKDEIQLQEMQKMQMQEKKRIEQNQAEIEELWHRQLLHDVQMKEEYERRKAEKLKQEMLNRRMAYDEQIVSASRKRCEMIQYERDLENKRLEKIKQRMELDYYDVIKRKKDQQLTNKRNYIEGFKMKMSRINAEKMQEREMDNRAIQIAKEELRSEKFKKLTQIQMQKREEQVFLETINHERIMAEDLQKETDRVINEWKEQTEQEKDKFYIELEAKKQKNRMKAAEEYKQFIEEKKRQMVNRRQEMKETFERVKQTAYHEMRNKLNGANEELRRQIEYRYTLKNQIRNNQNIMELELDEIERKQQPFTKKAIMFKEAMDDKVNHFCKSKNLIENPIHPFKKVMKTQLSKDDSTLPGIHKWI